VRGLRVGKLYQQSRHAGGTGLVRVGVRARERRVVLRRVVARKERRGTRVRRILPARMTRKSRSGPGSRKVSTRGRRR